MGARKIAGSWAEELASPVVAEWMVTVGRVGVGFSFLEKI